MQLRHIGILLGVTFALAVMVYFCALPGDLPASSDTSGGLPGTYSVNGVDPLGVDYSGTVVITERSDGAYDVQWIITGAIQQGVGRRIGGRFDVDWETLASGGGTGRGTATYAITDDGRLLGERTIEGADRVATEELFPDS